MFLFFCFFFLSGFCSLVYQVVWLRIAMAAFGVTTPFISIFLSVFMAGLAIGSWIGGELVRRLERRSGAFWLNLYAVSELAIGVSGLAVAPLLRSGRAFLEVRSPPRGCAGSTGMGPGRDLGRPVQLVVDREIAIGNLLGADPEAPTLTDDRPVNEYYFIRRVLESAK